VKALHRMQATVAGHASLRESVKGQMMVSRHRRHR
jgi:hypothetical protein